MLTDFATQNQSTLNNERKGPRKQSKKDAKQRGAPVDWANSLPNPTYEKLNRILVRTEWEQKYRLATVVALTREISDHIPLLLDSGDKEPDKKQSLFKFEQGWLLREGFFELVSEVWKKERRGTTSMQEEVQHPCRSGKIN